MNFDPPSESDIDGPSVVPGAHTYIPLPCSQKSSAEFTSRLQRREIIDARVRMTILVAGGTLVLVAHHFFYNWLDGRSIDDGKLSSFRAHLHVGMGEQAFANAIGNALATVARACFAGAIVTAFIQLFWWRLRRSGATIGHIDTVLSFQSNPLDPTSWIACFWYPLLATVALSSVALIAIPIATPGALTVDSSDSIRPCTVSTVDLSHAGLWSYADAHPATLTKEAPSSETYQLVARVLMGGTPLTPRFPAIPSLRSYNVTFAAPTLVCQDISASFDYGTGLGYNPWTTMPTRQVGVAAALVWNATYTFTGRSALQFVVASRDLGQAFVNDANKITTTGDHDDTQAVVCVPHNATYHALVQANDATPIILREVEVGVPFSNYTFNQWSPNEATSQFCLYDALARTINGTVTVAYLDTTTVHGNQFVAFSPLATISSANPWTWRGKLIDMLPSLMQNISLSLLSGVPLTEEPGTHDGGITPVLRDVETSCAVSGIRFQYDRARLLAVYLVAAGCTATAVLISFFAVANNGGIGETLDFSRIMGSGMDLPERMEAVAGVEEKVTLDTKVTAERKPFGRLVPVAITNDMP